MKVFVTGATGFIGSAVAAAFARAGHEAFGLARSAEKAGRLAAREVVPVLGSLEDPKSWREVADACQVLVHCAVEYSARQWTLNEQTIDVLLASATAAGRPRKVVVTGGVWDYGSTGDRMVDEASPLDPPALVLPRREVEVRVLKASSGSLKTLVIRPGCVYGGPGGLTAAWFESAMKEGAARIVGDGRNRWAMVHRHDLADVYLRAAESTLGGEVFNATDRSRFTVADCARAASLAAGAGGKVATAGPGEAARAMGAPFVECLSLDQHVDSSKAVRLLGWQPRHGGFADGAPRYFQAWKASR